MINFLQNNLRNLPEGSVSQNFDLGSRFFFMLCRNFMYRTPRSSLSQTIPRGLAIYWSGIVIVFVTKDRAELRQYDLCPSPEFTHTKIHT